MSDCETHLNTSGAYSTALNNLMDSLHINATTNFEPTTRCNNSFGAHFHSLDEDKFFSFCSTIKKFSKSDTVVEDKRSNSNQQNDLNITLNQCITDTPKRPVGMTRKHKLIESIKSVEEFIPNSRTFESVKNLSLQSLSLKKTITHCECVQRRQAKKVLSKKPTRTSLRV